MKKYPERRLLFDPEWSSTTSKSPLKGYFNILTLVGEGLRAVTSRTQNAKLIQKAGNDALGILKYVDKADQKTFSLMLTEDGLKTASEISRSKNLQKLGDWLRQRVSRTG